ncbi:Uncharacterised protein [BD1-7 clade bacterium]|uniref:Uncharacterized protein n=1 Tax=BD1-7 clade bacterium TaxID=2029982 RepID=A0A5S9PYS1_9GAMM|nr:Uncharacterised protein [BD1-7 clade bacterium]CAA0110268.1 Uncharacterised protein [BD1-7 clade bacterium]
MPILWNDPIALADSGQTLHLASINDGEEKATQASVDQATAKAVELLPDSLFDDAMFMLFEWNSDKHQLDINITDAGKKQNADIIVRVILDGTYVPGVELLKYWLKDYLSSSTGFLHYSLIAAFTDADRQSVQML